MFEKIGPPEMSRATIFRKNYETLALLNRVYRTALFFEKSLVVDCKQTLYQSLTILLLRLFEFAANKDTNFTGLTS